VQAEPRLRLPCAVKDLGYVLRQDGRVLEAVARVAAEQPDAVLDLSDDPFGVPGQRVLTYLAEHDGRAHQQGEPPGQVVAGVALVARQHLPAAGLGVVPLALGVAVDLHADAVQIAVAICRHLIVAKGGQWRSGPLTRHSEMEGVLPGHLDLHAEPRAQPRAQPRAEQGRQPRSARPDDPVGPQHLAVRDHAGPPAVRQGLRADEPYACGTGQPGGHLGGAARPEHSRVRLPQHERQVVSPEPGERAPGLPGFEHLMRDVQRL
jgi:hypothetical protein